MSKRTLRQILRRVHQTPPVDASPSPQLEQAAMDAYAHRRSARAWWAPQSLWARTAMASLMLVALLGVACELPTQAQVSMGQRIVMTVQPHDVGKSRTIEQDLQQSLSAAGAEKVRIAVERQHDGMLVLDVVAWDQDLTAAEVEGIVQEQLGDQLRTVNITSLSGTVSEKLGRRVLRQFFGFDIETETAENLRAGILEQLAAQGFDGDTHVEVLDEDGTRKITVEAESADGRDEIADEIIIQRDEP